ncbi:MAG TPA: alpha/beta hydrolase-fold protein [Polyangiaceae bacterium]
MRRRTFISATATLLGSPAALRGSPDAGSTSRALVEEELELPGDPKLARRALLLRPRVAPEATAQRVLVLLHGLGETRSEALGLIAWSKLYGLASTYERLASPPLTRTLPKARYLTDARLAELNRDLRERPFAGFWLVCPTTPNPQRLPPAERTLTRYADWLRDSLLPAVRKRLPKPAQPLHVGLDGCSMGGYVALEVFLRKPEIFGTFGGVQSAFGAGAASRYAERIGAALKRAGPRAIHLETSTGDPYRRANEHLSRKLTALGIQNQLRVIPGPHDQAWLREIGTLEMLLFHDRNLGRRA